MLRQWFHVFAEDILEVVNVLNGSSERVHLAQLLLLGAAREMLSQVVERGVDVSNSVPLPFVTACHRGRVVTEVVDVVAGIQEVFAPCVALWIDALMLIPLFDHSGSDSIHRRHSWHLVLDSSGRVVAPGIRGSHGRGLLVRML